MVLKMERQQASKKCENIRTVLKESLLNYSLTENPFSIYITVKKSFVRERSEESSQMFAPSSTPASDTSPINSSPYTPSPISLNSNQDSGFQNELINNVRKELVQTVIESNQEIANLKDELTKSKEKVATLEKDIESKVNNIKTVKPQRQRDP